MFPLNGLTAQFRPECKAFEIQVGFLISKCSFQLLKKKGVRENYQFLTYLEEYLMEHFDEVKCK